MSEGKDQVSSQLSKLSGDLVKNINKNDLTAALTFFDDDVMMMPPGQPHARGKDAARRIMSWVNDVKTLEMVAEEVLPLDPKAEFVMVRTYTKITNKKGEVPFDGKEVFIWKKTGQDYKISLNIYNINVPGECLL